MRLQPEERAALWGGLRQLGYVAACLGVTVMQLVLADITHGDTFKEMHFVENMQFCLLLLSAVVLLAFAGGRRSGHQPLGCLLASLCLLAACREMDMLFDASPILSWKIGFAFPLAAMAYALAKGRESLRLVLRFVNKPPCVMFTAAFLFIIVGQMIGHKPFLLDILGPVEHIGRIKEIFEEGVETIGYCTILCASLELFFTRGAYTLPEA